MTVKNSIGGMEARPTRSLQAGSRMPDLREVVKPLLGLGCVAIRNRWEDHTVGKHHLEVGAGVQLDVLGLLGQLARSLALSGRDKREHGSRAGGVADASDALDRHRR